MGSSDRHSLGGYDEGSDPHFRCPVAPEVPAAGSNRSIRDEDADPTTALRPYRESDAPTLWRWMYEEVDPEWRRWDGPYFPSPPPPPSEPMLDVIARIAATPHRRVISRAGECVGMVNRVEEPPVGGGWWDLGIVIYDPQHWGLGIGSEALRQWTELTFADTDAHVLTLTTWSGNERMIRSALRLGYRECARIPEARSWQGKRWDSVRLATLRADRPARSGLL